MAVRTETCVVLTCDRCADGWDGLEPHFATGGDALAEAARAGWLLTATRTVCPGCRPVEHCTAAGHRWGPWSGAGPFPRPGGGNWQGHLRYCELCSSAEWDPPPEVIVDK